jgi:DNA helicase-2/ATP-dependent DNA helicase PcrA
MIELDDSQKAVVNSEKQNIVVIAGAGSGKTTVLTERIRHLIVDKGVEPQYMCAITFTNLASNEMKERLADIPNVEDMFIGTIHSFANALLHMFGLYFDILSDEKYLEILMKLIKKYGNYLTVERATEYNDLKKAVSECKEHYSLLEDFFDDEEQFEYEMFERSVEEVKNSPSRNYPESVYSYAKEHGIITFDEIIYICKSKLGKDFSIDYLFVDEYQDTGVLEDNFIQALRPTNLFIVGDDWQSIYGFKGAVVNIFKRYVKQGEANPKEWGVYHLDNNYRCAKEIIDVAEKVINQDAEKIEKNVVCSNDNEGKYDYFSKSTDKESLTKHLIPILKEYKDNYKSWFFLTRTNKDLNDLIMLCDSINLPIMRMEKGKSVDEIREVLEIDKVKAMTVHSAKGLENENVLLLGDFPVFKEPPLKRKKETEEKFNKRLNKWNEERRIMYVAVTRAKKKLIIVSRSEEIEMNILKKAH